MEISVVIPLYNKKETIKRAIDSVLAQNYQPKEIIVVNDGSSDGSEKVVAEIQHPLIRLIHQDNGGVSAARNRGIQEAIFEWIAFLDADDIWDENYLKKIKSLHDNYPKAKVLATNYQYQLHSGKFKKTQINNLTFGEAEQGVLDNYFEVAATSNPPICSSAVVSAKSELQKISGFPRGIKSGEDLITWARLAIANEIAYCRTPLATFVLDPAHSYSDKPNRTPQTPDFVGIELQKLLEKNRTIPSIRHYLAHWHKMRASVYLRLGEKVNCLKEIFKSLSFSFFNLKLWIYLLLIPFPVSVVNRIFRSVN